ncbi:MAG TPA: substrate-binding domain-containing protein [Rariglobus sp.]|nr:substrate-binding domain-containing protein [Rariglobus sp.]
MVPSSLAGWNGDGIIVRIADPEVLALVKSKNVPVVDVLGNVTGAGIPSVICDDAAISQVAMEHFVERGFGHFAFLGFAGKPWSERRLRAFMALAGRRKGASFSSLEVSYEEKNGDNWLGYLQRLQEWIRPLPKPLAIMVGSDQLGADVLHACRALGVVVPGEVSVVGVDNDAAFCGVCVPTLSSVMANHEEAGYQAALMLNRLMTAKPRGMRSITIKPGKLQLRGSSDATASEDRNLIKAYQVIREEACRGLQVEAVAKAVGLSRSVLQRKFKTAFGHTVLDAIVMTRVGRAKGLLANTGLSIERVAQLSGFKNRAYLGYVFRRQTGQTVASFRNLSRQN